MLGISDKPLSFSDKILSKKDKAMSDVDFAQNLFREAFPESRYGSVKTLIFEAQRFINRHVKKDFTHRRARSIWEGTVRRIDNEEIEALKLARLEESKREQIELRARLAALDAAFAAMGTPASSRAMAAESPQESRVG